MDERNMSTQAAIVRVVKARKTVTHAALVSAVVSQLSGRFVPQVSDIKQNIDRLIEKEYMARDAEQIDVYRYLA